MRQVLSERSRLTRLMSFWHALSSWSLWVIVLNIVFCLCVCSPPLKLPPSDCPYLSLVFFPYSYALVLCSVPNWIIEIFCCLFCFGFFFSFVFPGQHIRDTVLCSKFESWLTVSQGIWETVAVRLVFLLDLEPAQCPCMLMLVISSEY